MSQFSEGPGWWIATDGKWYPPELYPSNSENPYLTNVTVPPASLYDPQSYPQQNDGTVKSFTLTSPVNETSKDSGGKRKTKKMIIISMIVVVLLIVSSIIVLVSSLHFTSSQGLTSGWLDRNLKIVGGSTPRGDNLIVVGVGSNQETYIMDVNANNGISKWKLPYNSSLLTFGVIVTPYVNNSVVLVLNPVLGVKSTFVDPEGVDINTGKILWQNAPVVVDDNPTQCGSENMVCLPVFSSAGNPNLQEIDSISGRVIRTIPDVSRQIGQNVYQTGDATPTLIQLSSTGEIAWEKTTVELFGSDADPNYGWYDNEVNGIDIMTISLRSTGSNPNLSSMQTIGVNVSTGSTIWKIPGIYDCEGTIISVENFVCTIPSSFNIKATSNSSSTQFTVEGFDPSTGKITWQINATNGYSLVMGNNQYYMSDDNVLIVTTSGTNLNLDLKTGATSQITSNDALWCSKTNIYKTIDGESTSGGNSGNSGSSGSSGNSGNSGQNATNASATSKPISRLGTPLLYSCNQASAPISITPKMPFDYLGASYLNLFIYPSTAGLKAVKLGS